MLHPPAHHARRLPAVAALERTVWGYTDAEDVVPPPVLIVSIKRGGILLGAFDDAERLQGFVYSMPGLKDGRPMQWSHMLGVVAGRARRRAGPALKLAQRDAALAMGLDLIEWTFDPLQALNAHFNFASSASSSRSTRRTSTAIRAARCTAARRPTGSSPSGASPRRTSSAGLPPPGMPWCGTAGCWRRRSQPVASSGRAGWRRATPTCRDDEPRC